MRLPAVLILTLALVPGLAAQKRDIDVPGPVELHIYLTAKAGQEAELERVYKEVFYPAVSRQEGFRSSQLMRQPKTGEFTVRLSFRTEELRMKWVASADHQRAWPALSGLSSKTTWQGFAVVHPTP